MTPADPIRRNGNDTEGYQWSTPGDVNAFFGLMIDNVSGMILMTVLLTAGFAFPAEFVLKQMIPGTALGVLVGDLLYTWMAFRLARRQGRNDVTAMPLGLDTPSTFGAAILILGPAFNAYLGRTDGGDREAAARHAWYIGMTMLLASGVFKLMCATVSPWIRRHVPRAGLLGSLVAIALVIISFLPLLDVAATPVAGFASLLIVLAALSARWELPGRASAGLVAAAVAGVCFYFLFATHRIHGGNPAINALIALGVSGVIGATLYRALRKAGHVPGVFMAVAIGSAIYYGMHAAGLGPGPGPAPGEANMAFALPFPFTDWWIWIQSHWREALGYLPIAIPLALATVVGGIDCVESAAAAGDEYPTGPIIAGEGLATLIAGMFGGVIQTTPYIGHPAYKAMGGRAAYTLATALVVGATGLFGLFPWVFHVVPRAVVFPILIFIGIEITQHSFRATPRRHFPALAFACVPALAYLALLMVERAFQSTNPSTQFEQLSPDGQHWYQTLVVLSSGFIVTSLIWGTVLARLIDGAWKTTAWVLAIAAALAALGIIHSALPGSPLLFPWSAVSELDRLGRLAASESLTPYAWAAAYLTMAAIVVVLGLAGRKSDPDEQPPQSEQGRRDLA